MPLAGFAIVLVAMQAPSIDHQAVGCVVADKHPRLEARVATPDAVAVARVLFQSEGARDWYAVAMKLEGPAFVGVLPKPKKSLKAFRYYVEVTDKAMATGRTSDFTANVVDDAAECKGRLVAGALASASVLLQVPAGVAAIPAGFAATGVAAAGGTVSGAAAAGTAAGTGGGVSTGAIVGIVAGAGAAAAGVAVAAGKVSGPDVTRYSGPLNGQWTIQSTVTNSSQVTNTCGYTSTLSGGLDLSLEQNGGSVTGSLSIQQITSTLTGVSGGCQPPGPGGPPFGQCDVTGSAGDFRCSFENNSSSTGSGPVQFTGTQTNKFSFGGSLSGGIVTGNITLSLSGQGTGISPGGGPFTQQYSASVTIPVTLR